MKPNYGEIDYWNTRYVGDTVYEWYRDFKGLRKILLEYLSKEAPILQIGTGISVLQAEMIQEGFQSVVNIDTSQVAVEKMQALHAGMQGLSYSVGDCRNMPQFPDSSFSAVLDKGTLDTLLCGGNAYRDVANMLAEVRRVLRPGGVYLLISYGTPLVRLPHLLCANQQYLRSVEVFGLFKEYDPVSGDPCMVGPFSALDSVAMTCLSYQAGLHFAYVCYRSDSPEQLPPSSVLPNIPILPPWMPGYAGATIPAANLVSPPHTATATAPLPNNYLNRYSSPAALGGGGFPFGGFPSSAYAAAAAAAAGNAAFGGAGSAFNRPSSSLRPSSGNADRAPMQTWSDPGPRQRSLMDNQHGFHPESSGCCSQQESGVHNMNFPGMTSGRAGGGRGVAGANPLAGVDTGPAAAACTPQPSWTDPSGVRSSTSLGQSTWFDAPGAATPAGGSVGPSMGAGGGSQSARDPRSDPRSDPGSNPHGEISGSGPWFGVGGSGPVNYVRFAGSMGPPPPRMPRRAGYEPNPAMPPPWQPPIGFFPGGLSLAAHLALTTGYWQRSLQSAGAAFGPPADGPQASAGPAAAASTATGPAGAAGPVAASQPAGGGEVCEDVTCYVAPLRPEQGGGRIGGEKSEAHPCADREGVRAEGRGEARGEGRGEEKGEEYSRSEGEGGGSGDRNAAHVGSAEGAVGSGDWYEKVSGGSQLEGTQDGGSRGGIGGSKLGSSSGTGSESTYAVFS